MQSPWQAPLPELQPAAQTIRLARGQTMQVWLAGGSQLVCNGAAVRVTEAPQWLLSQLVSRRNELGDGQAIALEHGGWVEIHAPQGGEVLCMKPVPPGWQRSLGSLARLLMRGWRGWRVSAARH
ncbi:hypothetical protein [Herbaspirillum robiniae]|uniref:DUF2917 domain-containing protein n=1 Tax=Herbaspirillum robiniae TaxID=2014887 RepID=A0ABX2M349_9BURK|nr:hypothetical protein [Herbaspirillum robiniae]NUU03688.1 hypothetical protein [Herbaspirillum robiniae]